MVHDVKWVYEWIYSTFCNFVIKNINKLNEINNRGVKQEGFVVLKGPKMA